MKSQSEFEEAVKMKGGKHPNPNTIHPIAGYDKEIYVKPTITNPNIIVGDFTYIADSDFESHVSHLYEWNDDKLIIGKFCQIAAGVEFVMNGANHQMNAVSTFPFYTLEGWEMSPPAKTDLPLKGDTVIENDVWIGQNSVILPGVHIGDGAIIGANSVVGSDVPPYTKVVGNPARAIQKRFDDELIELLLRFKWWDRSIDEINRLIPILTCSDLDKVKAEIKKAIRLTNSSLFMQHVLNSLNKKGKGAIVVSTGFLTAKSGVAKNVLTYIVDEHIVYGVISMPSNVFANTGTNVSVLFF